MQRIDNFINSFANPVFPLYLYGLGAAFFFISFVWFFYLLVKNPAIVDAYWPIGLIILASIFFLQRPVGGSGFIQAKLFFGAIVVWGCRLGIYLLVRIVTSEKMDSRYAHLQKNWGSGFKRHWNCLQQYYFQAFLQSILALAFLGLYTNERYYGVFYYIGLSCVVLSIVFSALADFQLAKFVAEKKIAADSGVDVSGKVMNRGLWATSRHPNYFFEWLVWVGFALMSVESFAGAWALLSPLVMYCIFTFLTIPLSEKISTSSRGEAYKNYCKNTSSFFPWFVKK